MLAVLPDTQQEREGGGDRKREDEGMGEGEMGANKAVGEGKAGGDAPPESEGTASTHQVTSLTLTLSLTHSLPNSNLYPTLTYPNLTPTLF